jgi:hypothetical protein
MIALTPSDQPLVNALTDDQERARLLAGWAEITAERRARYQMQMAAVGPKMETDDE